MKAVDPALEAALATLPSASALDAVLAIRRIRAVIVPIAAGTAY